MGHADNGMLMAYLDGELPRRDRSAIELHLRDCGSCDADLRDLEAMASRFSGALALADGQIPLLQARVRIENAQKVAGAATDVRSIRRFLGLPADLLKAAAVVLLVAGAASAAIPGTPLRRLIETVVERTATLFSGDADLAPVVDSAQPIEAEPPAMPPVQQALGAFVAFQPTSSAVRVSIHSPGANARITVRIVGGDELTVRVAGDDNSVITSGTSHVDVLQNTAGLIIEVPRGLARLTVDVDGEVYFVKDGDDTRLTVPGTGSGSNEFVFQARRD